MKGRLFIYYIIYLLTNSCMTMDMREVQKVQNDHDARICFLEEWVGGLNEEILNLQKLIQAIEEKDYITSIIETSEGVTIHFTHSDPITLLHGAKGEQGPDGNPGQNGQNGTNGVNGNNGQNGLDAPIMGVKKENGRYYWTMTIDGNTEFLTDTKGQRIPVTGNQGETGDTGKPGTNGQPGTTPTLSISPQGNWAVNGEEILVNGAPLAATGPAGDKGSDGKPGQGGNGSESSTYFQSIDTSNPNYVTFTLKDGSHFTLPICQEIAFEIVDAGFPYRLKPGTTHTLSYTGKNIQNIAVTTTGGWHTVLDPIQKRLTISAPENDNFNAAQKSMLTLIASNNQGQQIVATRNLYLIRESYRIDLTACNSPKTDVYLVKCPDGTPLAEICYEYVKGYTETACQRSLVVYPWSPTSKDYITGYVVANGGQVNRNGSNYIANSLAPCSSITIDILGNLAPEEEALNTCLPEPEIVTDFEANLYGIVKIGKQYWMKENYRGTKFQNAKGNLIAIETPKVYDAYKPGSEATFSWLYDYAKLFLYQPENQDFFPDGWHLPNSKEMNELICFIPQARDLRAVSTAWTSASGNDNTNLSGFGALPGGYINRNIPSQPHEGLYTYGEFWTSSEQSGVKNPVLRVNYNTDTYTLLLPNNYAEQRSIRCIRDSQQK